MNESMRAPADQARYLLTQAPLGAQVVPYDMWQAQVWALVAIAEALEAIAGNQQVDR